jgi:large subunit ribosomal protein L24e
MVKCVFCGREESPHRGVHLIKNDGFVDYFCSSKCKLNSLKLKRDKRKIKWTESFHLERKKKIERKLAVLEEEKQKEAEKAQGKNVKKKVSALKGKKRD